MDLSKSFINTLEIIPSEDWCRTWPADRTIMLRMTSKRVKNAVDKIRPPTIISFNRSFWNNPNISTSKKQELMMMYLSEISIRNIIVSFKICNIELFYELSQYYCEQNFIEKCSPGINILTSAINTQETLTNINLNFCKIGLMGVIKLALFIVNCQRLTHLNICNNNIGSTGIYSLATALKNCLLLSHIDLSWNHIGPNGADSLAKVLILLKIKYLNLSGNRICNIGSEKVAIALTNNPVLQHLDFSWNHIGSDGAFSIVRLLGLVKLKYLNLGANRIDDKGIEKLSIALLNYPVIEHINLNDNQIGPNGVYSLARLLRQCSSLKHLELCCNQLNDIAIESLASALGYCLSLIHLNLSGNIIGNTGANKLSINLTKCTALMYLDLSYNKIGPDGADNLSRILKQCKVSL